jgi:putative membrane protein
MRMKILLHWLIAAVAILIAAYIVPGVSVNFISALVAAVVLGALNLFIKPIILILTLPINILTLGLFSLVINACIVLLAALVVPGFGVAGFGSALLFAIVLAIINWIFNSWGEKA